MRKIQLTWLFMFTLALWPAVNIMAQPNAVRLLYRGKVTELNDNPVIGALVKSKNGNDSTTTDVSGTFSITTEKGGILVVSKPGFTTQEIIAADEPATFIVRLLPEREAQFIYHQTPENLRIASSGVVYGEEIKRIPVTNFRNTLSGRLAGLYTLQASGLPGGDGAALTLRGQTPVVIIDGVVANLTQFDLEEIESITVLKDALSTAMLGVRANGGAIVVTTKKGRETRQQLSFTAQTAVQKPIGLAKTLNAFNYASLKNEALRNDGIDSSFSGLYYPSAALQAYQTGSDPFNFPDNDYFSQIAKNSSLLNRYTLSATGGSKVAKYFVSLEHINQSGFFKTVDSNSYNTNNNFKSYVLRSNVDVNITPKLTAGIYLLGRILNGNEPGSTTGTILSNLLNTPANAYPLLNRNGSFGGNQLFQNNILAQTIGSGYLQNYKRDILVNMYLKKTLDEVTPGLWAQVKASYYATLSETYNRSKSFAVFQQGSGTAYNQFGTVGAQANGNGLDYQGRSDYEEFSIGYDRTFKKHHGINAQVLVNRDNNADGPDLPYTITGTSGRLAYNFDGKYMAEVAFGYNGSNRYPDNGKTKRGFFPSAGLGWNIDQENFFKSVSFFNRLKLYASIGQTGFDNPGYFVYYPRYFDGPGGTFGTGAGGVTTITEGTLPNRNITWEKATKLNVGLNGAVLNDRLSFNVEYYRNKYSDLLQLRGTNSSIIGNDLNNENIGERRYTGWEGTLTWQQTVRKFQYFISVNGSTVGSKVLFMDEVPRQHEWMKQTGQPVGQAIGYLADGLFQTAAEAAGSATIVGYKAQAGDIKFRDLNGDGVINQYDQTAIGSTKPLFFYGASLGLSYGGFDINALLQGVKNRNIYLSGNSYWAFQNNGTGQAYNHNLNRWTPATAATATYPRLSYGTNINNDAVSSFWMHSGDYIRLKNLEVGYSFPASLIGKIKLQTVRIFANGYNLLTSASEKALDGRDPESFTGGYPIQRVFNFGLNIKF